MNRYYPPSHLKSSTASRELVRQRHGARYLKKIRMLQIETHHLVLCNNPDMQSGSQSNARSPPKKKGNTHHRRTLKVFHKKKTNTSNQAMHCLDLTPFGCQSL